MNGLFITGTDTEVGKTRFSCAVIRTLREKIERVAAYKPVASGGEDEKASDAYLLWEATGRLGSMKMVCPQSFVAPLAPPLAAALENREVDRELLEKGARDWRGQCDFLVVEGAGGLLSPLTFESTNADLAKQIGWPIVIVVADRLGAVNQSLLAFEAASSRNLVIAAIVLNATTHQSDSQKSNHHASMIKQQLQATNRPIPTILKFSYGQTELVEAGQPFPSWLASVVHDLK